MLQILEKKFANWFINYFPAGSIPRLSGEFKALYEQKKNSKSYQNPLDYILALTLTDPPTHAASCKIRTRGFPQALRHPQHETNVLLSHKFKACEFLIVNLTPHTCNLLYLNTGMIILSYIISSGLDFVPVNRKHCCRACENLVSFSSCIPLLQCS
jgi:hypothetical protein